MSHGLKISEIITNTMSATVRPMGPQFLNAFGAYSAKTMQPHYKIESKDK